MTTGSAASQSPANQRSAVQRTAAVLFHCLLPISFCLLPFGSAGCRSNSELIENELRIKDRQLEGLREELRKKDCDIKGLERDIEQLQRKPKPGDPPPIPMLVESLSVGRLTGGLDEDPHCPGDEGLQILVEPRDCDKQTVKAPGSLRVDVFEINQQGLKSLLSTWELNARELRRTWDDPAFGGAAYRVVLRWTKWPKTERLKLVVRFVTPQGVNFEAEKDVTIHLPERPKPNPEHASPDVPKPGELPPDLGPLVVPPPQGLQQSGYRTRPLVVRRTPGDPSHSPP